MFKTQDSPIGRHVSVVDPGYDSPLEQRRSNLASLVDAEGSSADLESSVH